RRVMFAEARLDMLQQVMGEEQFEAAIAETRAKWDHDFTEVEEKERNLSPCLICGCVRVFANVSFLDNRICGGCEAEMDRGQLGSCRSCGGERELVGSAYTEGFCYDCADKQLTPCRDCGGKRMVGDKDKDGGLCWACLDHQFGPCADCGRQMTSCIASF